MWTLKSKEELDFRRVGASLYPTCADKIFKNFRYFTETGKKKEYAVGHDGEAKFMDINVKSQVDYSLQSFGRWHDIDGHQLIIKPGRINKWSDACKQDLQIYLKVNLQTHGHSTQSAGNLI